MVTDTSRDDDDEDSSRRNRLHHDHQNRKSNKKSKGRKGEEHGKRRRHKMRGCDKELELESESESELENSADDDSASSYSSSSSSSSSSEDRRRKKKKKKNKKRKSKKRHKKDSHHEHKKKKASKDKKRAKLNDYEKLQILEQPKSVPVPDIVEQSGASELSAALPGNLSQLKRNESTAPVIPSAVSNVNSASGSTGVDVERSQRQGQRRMTPMTREEYEAERLQIREVYDEETGRYRLVRGTGEILERIVSRSDHARINQQATRGDGNSFSNSVFHAAASKYRR